MKKYDVTLHIRRKDHSQLATALKTDSIDDAIAACSFALVPTLGLDEACIVLARWFHTMRDDPHTTELQHTGLAGHYNLTIHRNH